MAKKIAAPAPPVQEVDALLLKVLDRQREGLTADQLRRALPPSHRLPSAQIEARLQALVAQGQAYGTTLRAGTRAKARTLYAPQPLEAVVEARLLDAVRVQPQTPAALKRALPASLRPLLDAAVESLRRGGRLYQHPPGKGKRQLSLTPPDPLIYLSSELKKLLSAARRLGFSTAAVLQAVERAAAAAPAARPGLPARASDSPDDEQAIVQAMLQLQPAAANGALVYLPDLRRALADRFPDKPAFDAAVLHLARQEKVQLQSHSLPAELTPEQRDSMIDNGRGSYFMAIGLMRT